MLELNKIYCADCLEIMKSIPDKSIDLVLTDPPYGIWIKGKVGGEKLAKVTDYWDFNDWDNDIPSKEYFDEMIRISKHCIIFWGNYFIENLTNSSCWIVWDKDNTWNFADCELAWTNFDTAVRKIKIRWNGMLQDDMKNKEIRYHPTQKPVDLFKWILENYSEKWMTILDPFLWSWTTAVACKELGRNFIGIEKEQKYVDIANKRLQTATPSLFT
jgi:DNA modification methylase